MSDFDPQNSLDRGRALLRRLRLFVFVGVVLYAAWFSYSRRPGELSLLHPDAPPRPFWLEKVPCGELSAESMPESGWVRVEGCRVQAERVLLLRDGLWVALGAEEAGEPAPVLGRFPEDRRLLVASVSGGDLEAGVFEVGFDAYLGSVAPSSLSALGRLDLQESPLVLVPVER